MPSPIDFPDLIRTSPFRRRSRLDGIGPRLEPFIQRVVRIRMRQRRDYDRLRPRRRSSDVCQSVFRSLFRGLKENRFQLDQPGDLEKLLQVMIRYNIATKARRSGVRLRELIDDFEPGGMEGLPAHARIRKSPSKT